MILLTILPQLIGEVIHILFDRRIILISTINLLFYYMFHSYLHADNYSSQKISYTLGQKKNASLNSRQLLTNF